MRSPSSTSSFRHWDVLIALALIILGETAIHSADPEVTVMRARPHLVDLLTHSSDRMLRDDPDASLAVIGDSTGMYGFDMRRLDALTGRRCINNSRTNHFGIGGIAQVIRLHHRLNPECRDYLVPIHCTTWMVPDGYNRKIGLVPRWQRSQRLAVEDPLDLLPKLPSRRLGNDVSRRLFWDPDRIRQGRWSGRQWIELHRNWRGSLVDARVWDGWSRFMEAHYRHAANPSLRRHLDELLSWARDADIRLRLVMTPAPESAVIWRREHLGRDLDEVLEMFEDLLERDERLNPTWPVWEDSLFCDSFHLNRAGQERFTRQVADWLRDAP